MSSKTCNNICLVCFKYVKRVSGTPKYILTSEDTIEISTIFQRDVTIGDFLCGKCRLTKYKKLKTEPKATTSDNTVSEILYKADSSLSDLTLTQSSSQSSNFEDPTYTVTFLNDVEYIEVPLKRTISTHKYCCICYTTNKNLVVVPLHARMQSFTKRRIFIPIGNRCCADHIINKKFYYEDLNRLKVYSHWTTLEATELSKIMENIAVQCNATLLDKVDNYQLSNEKLYVFTGLNWENIIEIRDLLTSMRNTDIRSITQALIVFLFKLRTGNSNKLIASILELDEEQLVSTYSEQVIKSFEKDILPLYFGFNKACRDDLVKNHTTAIVKNLHDTSNDKLFVICDGTYARHQKSSNNQYQRKSYSVQKGVSLCKPFTICTTDGYIINMLGPYYANQNDATIMKEVIDDSNGLSLLLKPGDVFVVDRGFRDVKEYLEEKGYQVLMPSFKGKRNQLTTAESNSSRFVTKIRWTVESTHGMLKQKYRLLDQKFDNKMLPRISSLYKIASFLHNKYNKRLNSDVEYLDEIVESMKSRNVAENTLFEEVKRNGWQRKKLCFKTISSSDLLDFPEITEKDLIILFSGTYQYKQAISYLAEMMDDSNNITIQFVKDKSNILKALVQSRHMSRKIYRCFIEYNRNSIGYYGVKRYCCECANGLRTVGCCSHIAAIIYYLAYGRYLSNIPRPAEVLNDLFNKDHVDVIIDQDSDED
ncbi:uncharacterized protein [Prorops nasuta]|uniref:uncharacterized protein n=1 Tax=Prorops nasuta TaxID=863751 RepID=UPI0034CF7DA2